MSCIVTEVYLEYYISWSKEMDKHHDQIEFLEKENKTTTN